MRTLMTVLFLGLWSVVVVCAQPAAGLRWTAPAGWKSEPARSMRAATYTIAPATGDKTGAECAVYFFGAGQGGSVDANIDRWKGQFEGGDGRAAKAQVAKRTIRGLTMTTIDTSGEYLGMGGPMGGAPTAAAGYRMLGAIVEGPSGNVFVKFTGPEKTIAANQQKFEQLLASFQKEQ
jgi:hypothetical protein